MADAYHHARSSVNIWGGEIEDYLPIHQWFDDSKNHFNDNRHRAARHHSEGIGICIQLFGPTTGVHTDKKGVLKLIPTRWIAEQHVKEDMGFIPTMADWLREINLKPWMVERAVKLSRIEL